MNALSNGGTYLYNYITVYPSKLDFSVTPYLVTYIYSFAISRCYQLHFWSESEFKKKIYI